GFLAALGFFATIAVAAWLSSSTSMTGTGKGETAAMAGATGRGPAAFDDCPRVRWTFALASDGWSEAKAPPMASLMASGSVMRPVPAAAAAKHTRQIRRASG